MIIVSQDKDVIVNFNNVENIWINNPLENNEGKFEIRAESYSNNIFIGEYTTEERAKQVLQEIIEVFTTEEFFHINKSSLNNLDELAEPKYILRPVSKSKVYRMPEM